MRGAATTWLGSDAAPAATVGIVGFCMGGALALVRGHARTDAVRAVRALLRVHGVHRAAKPDSVEDQGGGARPLRRAGPMLTPASRSPSSRPELRGAGKDVEFIWYPGADHAFFNDTRPEVYDADAARLSWDRTRAFLRTHLATTVAPV